MIQIGITQASNQAVATPLPISWLGRADMPPSLPAYAAISTLSSTQVRNLLAQIGYDQSSWNYAKIGSSNQLGKYQIDTLTLEDYGLLAVGSNATYGTDSVNRRTCWRPVTIRKNTNGYSNYLYNTTRLSDFLSNQVAQEHLAYQRLYDLYNDLTNVGAILSTDTTETVAGMIYVGWVLGVGTSATSSTPSGTGAWAWRYSGIGLGVNAYNAGRYAITVLSQ